MICKKSRISFEVRKLVPLENRSFRAISPNPTMFSINQIIISPFVHISAGEFEEPKIGYQVKG